MMEDEFSDSGIYEIEKLLSRRWRGNRYQYLIRWKGNDSSEDEWVDEHDIKAKDLVEEYNLKHKKTPSRRSRSTQKKEKPREEKVKKSSQETEETSDEEVELASFQTKDNPDGSTRQSHFVRKHTYARNGVRSSVIDTSYTEQISMASFSDSSEAQKMLSENSVLADDSQLHDFVMNNSKISQSSQIGKDTVDDHSTQKDIGKLNSSRRKSGVFKLSVLDIPLLIFMCAFLFLVLGYLVEKRE